jgi:hypothetical protein
MSARRATLPVNVVPPLCVLSDRSARPSSGEAARLANCRLEAELRTSLEVAPFYFFYTPLRKEKY